MLSLARHTCSFFYLYANLGAFILPAHFCWKPSCDSSVWFWGGFSSLDTKVLTFSLLELFCFSVHHPVLSPDSNIELHGGAPSLLSWSPTLTSITRLHHGALSLIASTRLHHRALPLTSRTELSQWSPRISITRLHHEALPLISTTELYLQTPSQTSITGLHQRAIPPSSRSSSITPQGFQSKFYQARF